MKKTELTEWTLLWFENVYKTDHYTEDQIAKIELAAYNANMKKLSCPLMTESDVYASFLADLYANKIELIAKIPSAQEGVAAADKTGAKPVTRAWKIYGRDGHRQAVSFHESVCCDWSQGNDVRIVELINADITGTNDYSILNITRNTADECYNEMDGQTTDGFFENYRVGDIEEIEWKWFTACAENGELIEGFNTYAEAKEALAGYYADDASGCFADDEVHYEEGFYDIETEDHITVDPRCEGLPY